MKGQEFCLDTTCINNFIKNKEINKYDKNGYPDGIWIETINNKPVNTERISIHAKFGKENWEEPFLKIFTSEKNHFNYYYARFNDVYMPNQIMVFSEYKNGVLDGAKISFYPNGNISSIKYFKNGNSIGGSVDYYENGNLRTISMLV